MKRSCSIIAEKDREIEILKMQALSLNTEIYRLKQNEVPIRLQLDIKDKVINEKD